MNRASAPGLDETRARLAEAEETLRAIRSGEVDSVVVGGKQGDRVFTLLGAEHAYRVLIESMNEGAVTLTRAGLILYANRCFAVMVGQPLEKVIGTSFHRFLDAESGRNLRPLLRRAGKAGSKLQAVVGGEGETPRPAQISIRLLARNGFNQETIGLVVTDMSEARRSEEMLRALTNRVVEVQEAERGRVAIELHDKITQHLVAALYRSQKLAETLVASQPTAGREAVKLRQLLGAIVADVERISRDLRPSMLDQLGFSAVLRDTARGFSSRTGVPVTISSSRFSERMPADAELAFYRILQESLKNIEKHARARRVHLSLRTLGDVGVLGIRDNGVGFNPARPARPRKKGSLGLLGMRERATYLGGTLRVVSRRGAGTSVEARIPLAARIPAAS